MLTLHFLVRSRAQRLLWLLEELELPYELKVYQRDPQTFLSLDDLKAVHPLGKSPTLTDGDVTLAESGAIFDYVLTRHGSGRLVPPVTSPDWPNYLFILHSTEGSTQVLVGYKFTLDQVVARAPEEAKALVSKLTGEVEALRVTQQVKRMFDLLESMLTKTTWLTGNEFTAADIMAAYAAEGAASRFDLMSGRPKLAAWLQRAQQRPAYLRAKEKGAAVS